ncbi:hypothetical protein [Staphylococcus petrasii]|uniref:hypothetical protein n=1 Tax=Staphylococcus petrasii TaxID=1276936 RepID=UPI003F674A28
MIQPLQVYVRGRCSYAFTSEELKDAEENEITEHVIKKRMKSKWDKKDILNTPPEVKLNPKSERKPYHLPKHINDIKLSKKDVMLMKKKHRNRGKIESLPIKRTYPPVERSAYYFDLLNFATKHLKAGEHHG